MTMGVAANDQQSLDVELAVDSVVICIEPPNDEAWSHDADPIVGTSSQAVAVKKDEVSQLKIVESSLQEHSNSDIANNHPSGLSKDATYACETSCSPSDNSGLGKRKRRPPPSPDERDLSQNITGWNRLALTLLGRVMRFRSLNGDKNRSNPSAWFNQPVDAEEVPDYYDIIQNPMDFGTIKKKLETGVYSDWSAFHVDMLLVRDNCRLYNAAGTQVRHDCELVFNFYLQEVNRMSTKFQQGPPQYVKRQRFDQNQFH
jgi:hypothetical protein